MMPSSDAARVIRVEISPRLADNSLVNGASGAAWSPRPDKESGVLKVWCNPCPLGVRGAVDENGRRAMTTE